MHKRCPSCKIIKTRDEFGELSNGVTKNTGVVRYRCKSCANKVLRDYRAEFKEKNGKNYESSLIDTEDKYFSYCLKRAFYNSKKRKDHSDFNLTEDFIKNLFYKQSGLCALSGEKMTMILGKGRVHSNLSIDRINSDVGYVKDNIHLTTWIANAAKNNLTLNSFIALCFNVVKTSNIGGKQIGLDKDKEGQQ